MLLLSVALKKSSKITRCPYHMNANTFKAKFVEIIASLNKYFFMIKQRFLDGVQKRNVTLWTTYLQFYW
jgi:hypothetical protein